MTCQSSEVPNRPKAQLSATEVPNDFLLSPPRFKQVKPLTKSSDKNELIKRLR